MKYLWIAFLFIIPGCAQQKFKPGDQMAIYFDYTNSQLVLLNIETKAEYPVLNTSPHFSFLFWGDNKIVIVPNFDAEYYSLYDIATNKVERHNYQMTKADDDIITGARICNDSLLVLSGINNIYCEALNGSYSDRVISNLPVIIQMECNRNGILAVLYTDDERYTSFKDNHLLFYDFKEREIIKTKNKPFMLRGWSHDGKYLSYDDSAEVKLEYPSLKLVEDNFIDSEYKILNDTLLVYQKKISDSNELSSEYNQLFLYNTVTKSTIQLTNKPSKKQLFDVYSK